MSTPNTHHGAERLSALLAKDRCEKIFFCGLGGVNMSSLAHMAMELGYKVAGSDRTESDLTRALSAAGADVRYGHSADNVIGCDAFVYTVAIAPDNPEYVKAGELGIPRISRADFLGYVMTAREMRIGICGTHGKSTTTAMCHSIFEAAGADPTVMCGSALSGIGSPYRPGRGKHFIFEACEYMDSFLDFNPTAAVILNVEMDHVDYFHSIEQMRQSYASFAKITEKNGAAIYNADDENTVKALESYRGRRISFGIKNENADFRASDIEFNGKGYSFTVLKNGGHYLRAELSVPGRHNILDALAAVAASYYGGIAPEDAAKGLSLFSGTHRRMEYKGELNGAPVFDDYAHHPTEIAATLEAARSLCGDGKVVCVFQSHTYSRTHALMDGFAEVLKNADKVLIAPIFPARETDTLGVDQYKLAERIGPNAAGFDRFGEIAEALSKTVSENDVAVIMGAGNINEIFPILDLKNAKK
jgi:UDP-N-acetylmuramate--alanine ligase